jgi:hypothetical protein
MYWKTPCTARGIRPGFRLPVPFIVYVFPEAVCPYANIVPVLYIRRCVQNATAHDGIFVRNVSISDEFGILEMVPLMPSMAELTIPATTLSYICMFCVEGPKR